MLRAVTILLARLSGILPALKAWWERYQKASLESQNVRLRIQLEEERVRRIQDGLVASRPERVEDKIKENRHEDGKSGKIRLSLDHWRRR